MTLFAITLRTITPVVIGRWLTLDAVLDGILEADGIEANERVLPILAWDGTSFHEGVSTQTLRDNGWVHAASALVPAGTDLDVADPESGSDASFTTTRPNIFERTWRRGATPAIDFTGSEMPFSAGRGAPADKFDIKRGDGASFMTTKRCLSPGKIRWLARGDGEAAAEILRGAMGIGGKIAAGMGRFDSDSIYVDDFSDREDAAALAGIFDIKGTRLWRPVPAAMLEGLNTPVKKRLSRQTCRSPYWDPNLAEPAFVPVASHYDGILSA